MSVQQLIVVVASKNISRVEEFKGKRYGEQSAGMLNGGDFPTGIKVRVEEGHEYDPGEYIFAPSSYIADEMGNPKLKRIRLLPLGGSSAAAPGKK